LAAALNPEPRRNQHVLLYFLGLSLALHLLVLLYLNFAKLSLGEGEPPPLVVKLAQLPPTAPPAAQAPPNAAKKAPANAAQVPPPPPPSKQIVAPSDQENQLPPLNEAYLSDRDNRVDKQTVHHGNPEAGAHTEEQKPPPDAVASAPPPEPRPAPPSKPEPRVEPAPPKAAPPPKEAMKKAARPSAPPKRVETASEEPGETIPRGKPLPGLDQLLAPPGEVLAKADLERAAREQAREERPAAQAQGRGDARSDPRRDLVSAPPPAPGIFGGVRGTFDDLDLAQGNLTMLNTKADRFAPFVRRVGTRVFQNLLIFQRRNLGVQDILAAHEPIMVRAVLDKNGKLKTLDVSDRSGSLAVDQTLIDACRQAAFDQNPPNAAANSNGEFEFLFEAQLFAGVGSGPDGPQLRSVESRLRVGLL
jgi:hypothetical protein